MKKKNISYLLIIVVLISPLLLSNTDGNILGNTHFDFEANNDEEFQNLISSMNLSGKGTKESPYIFNLNRTFTLRLSNISYSMKFILNNTNLKMKSPFLKIYNCNNVIFEDCLFNKSTGEIDLSNSNNITFLKCYFINTSIRIIINNSKNINFNTNFINNTGFYFVDIHNSNNIKIFNNTLIYNSIPFSLINSEIIKFEKNVIINCDFEFRYLQECESISFISNTASESSFLLEYSKILIMYDNLFHECRIKFLEMDMCIITDNSFLDTKFRLIRTSNTTFEDNLIENKGVEFLVANNILICNNTVFGDDRVGMDIEFGINISIANNDISHSYVGLDIREGIDIHVFENYIHDTIHGAYLHLYNSIIESNNVSDNSYGFRILPKSENNLITNNTFWRNSRYAIHLNNSMYNTIHSNRFYYNHLSSDQYFEGRIQAYDGDPFNNWSIRIDGKFIGNYWHDWNSVDKNCDGICDEPYLIDGPGEASDPYPIFEPHNSYFNEEGTSFFISWDLVIIILLTLLSTSLLYILIPSIIIVFVKITAKNEADEGNDNHEEN